MEQIIRFGIIGCDLMGREFASVIARWCHLTEDLPKPVLVAVCDTQAGNRKWFTTHFPGIHESENYKDLLEDASIDAIYCAVPHNLHERLYVDIINAKKHLLGEKPFGIDRQANENILEAINKNKQVVVRCSSEFPFSPAMQEICSIIEHDEIGEILQVEAGFIHSSDLNPLKPISWKRLVQYNGEYGCMGDLGMHACHVPFKAGWVPTNVRAILSKIVKERPVAAGSDEYTSCETWDNATLFCEAIDPKTKKPFPMTIKTMRIAPGETNTWYFSILGTKTSVRFSTKNINTYERIVYHPGGAQNWETIDVGHKVSYSTITGSIFEFGFSDAILQMWAAFLYEIAHEGKVKSKFSGCVTPQETKYSHELFTAALKSHETRSVVSIPIPY